MTTFTKLIMKVTENMLQVGQNYELQQCGSNKGQKC